MQTPGNAQADLWQAVRALNVAPDRNAMRLVIAFAAGELHGLAIQVDQVFAAGRVLTVNKSVVGIWQTRIPDAR